MDKFRWHNRQPEQDFIPEKKGREEKCSLWDSLAKALLITFLVMGAQGGFLSAFEVDYSAEICVAATFLCAIIFSVAYDHLRDLWRNLILLLFLAFYLYLVFRNFWAINSGFYAVINVVQVAARDYLGITNGTEYVLRYEDVYTAVTYFVLLFAVTQVLLFSIHLSRKTSPCFAVLWTAPFYVIALYLEKVPALFPTILLFSGYLTVWMLRVGRVKGMKLRQVGVRLAAALLVCTVISCMAALMVPRWSDASIVPSSKTKEGTKDFARNFVQYGVMMLWNFNGGGAGMSGGVLGRGGSPMPDYETDLVVEYTPYSYDTVYLKAFVGETYTGTRWEPPEQDQPGVYPVGERNATAEGLLTLFEALPEKQGKGRMRVANVGADNRYEYVPYYADEGQTERSSGNEYLYTYYPYNEELELGQVYVSDACYEVPENCYDAVARVCAEAGFSGSSQEIAEQVTGYFAENYSYTLRPGYIWGNDDYISYFLRRNKKGYCMHFASAATMLLRQMGIPARYVEGYAISYTDWALDGELVRDALYEDYFEGYSALGETGLIRIEVPDAWAHAWVEIYVEGKGWIVVDPTPASAGEERESFWETFRNMGGQTDGDGLFGEEGRAIIRETVSRAMRGFFVAVPLVLLFLFGRMLYKLGMRRKLTCRQLVGEHYRSLLSHLQRRHEELEKQVTIHEQLAYLAENCGLPAEEAKALERTLYDAFYGEVFDEEKSRELSEVLKKWKRTLK